MTHHYASPGVYVEEVPSAVKPIAGVGTSTAAFIGLFDYTQVKVPAPVKGGKPGEYKEVDVTRDDPADPGTPMLITNWGQFVKHFGNLVGPEQEQGNPTQVGNTDDSTYFRYLAHAVYGFFNNGGTRCYVVQVDGTNKTLDDALNALAAIDEVALVAIPGRTDQSNQDAVVGHCEDENLQDRFAILDGEQSPSEFNKQNIAKSRNSSYAAIYFPWIKVFDPGQKLQEPEGDGGIWVPPSGHLAGIYARVDSQRGVHKAPANEVMRGALGVQTLISKEVQAGLNPDGINVIRQFDGNVTVWGARTWADPNKEPDWKYVNVRRLFLFLRESIDKGTQWVVFEPNDSGLWAKITRNVTAFLTNVWRAGALFGDTPQQAFYVKCDEETNPPEVRDQGQVVTEIGVAVVKPAEFVVFRISQWAGPGG